MAEYRSTKPNAAGSIPVAHSNFLQARSLTGKMSVSKTEVFSSNLNVPAKFKFSRKVCQIGYGSSPENYRARRLRVRVLHLPPNLSAL